MEKEMNIRVELIVAYVVLVMLTNGVGYFAFMVAQERMNRRKTTRGKDPVGAALDG